MVDTPTTNNTQKTSLPTEQQRTQDFLQNLADRIWQARHDLQKIQTLIDIRVDQSAKGTPIALPADYSKKMVDLERATKLLLNDLL